MPAASDVHEETIIEVWVNCPDIATAVKIADDVVVARLAACSNIYPPIISQYRWKGAVETAEEVPLLLKTRQSLFDALAERIAEYHAYETPSIVGHEIKHAATSYRRWIIGQTLPGSG